LWCAIQSFWSSQSDQRALEERETHAPSGMISAAVTRAPRLGQQPDPDAREEREEGRQRDAAREVVAQRHLRDDERREGLDAACEVERAAHRRAAHAGRADRTFKQD
jgi:hypothetical protein